MSQKDSELNYTKNSFYITAISFVYFVYEYDVMEYRKLRHHTVLTIASGEEKILNR